MIIAVAGMGYVGLSVACLLAQKHEVHAVDIMQKRSTRLTQGHLQLPIRRSSRS